LCFYVFRIGGFTYSKINTWPFIYFFFFFLTEKHLAETQPELGAWSDGKGEDELSPEEIQMVTLSLPNWGAVLRPVH
jgi:hypothetical protein